MYEISYNVSCIMIPKLITQYSVTRSPQLMLIWLNGVQFESVFIFLMHTHTCDTSLIILETPGNEP